MDRVFVSRGGIKLQEALDKFNLVVSGKTVLDVGSSTGGFVDCLLQNGVSKVFAVDTAYGELNWKLRNDPRVVVMERTNILHLETLPSNSHPELVSGSSKYRSRTKFGMTKNESQNDKDNGAVDIVTIDAGWTRLELVLPVVKKILKTEGVIIALLKPHYETKQRLLKKGVVPEDLVDNIKNQVLKNIENLGFDIEAVIESPILGGAGNREFLLKISVSR